MNDATADEGPGLRPIDIIRAGIAAGPDRRKLTLADRRQAMVELAQANPAPADVRFEQTSIAGVSCERSTAPNVVEGRLVLYFHGGGYIGGAPRAYRGLVGELSRRAKAAVLSIDYRLAPEHPFPAAVEDAMAVYGQLVSQYPGAQIAIAGDSAGGGLSLVALQEICRQKLLQPVGGVLMSPWCDLRRRPADAPSRDDPMITPEAIGSVAKAYLQGHDPVDPLASPMLGAFSGLPPLLIQVGSNEILLDDAIGVDQAARRSGVEVTLEVWPEMIHVWHIFQLALPDARAAVERAGRWLQQRWSPTAHPEVLTTRPE
jgi:monoterpene epsilon-lactone hydrolase